VDRRDDHSQAWCVDALELQRGLEAVAEMAIVELVGLEVDAYQRHLATGLTGHTAPGQRLVDAVSDGLGGGVRALLDRWIAHDLETGDAGRGRHGIAIVGAGVGDPTEALPLGIV